jgi:hypothetical protein
MKDPNQRRQRFNQTVLTAGKAAQIKREVASARMQNPPPAIRKGTLLGGALLDVPAVTLKFSFYEDEFSALIPPGIEDNGHYDSRAEKGYKDDGRQEIQAHGADLSSVRIGLANNGYRVMDAWMTHKFDPDMRPKARPGTKRKKIVIDVCFAKGVEATELDAKVQEGLRVLTGQTKWKDVVVWVNPDNELSSGGSISINARGPLRKEPEQVSEFFVENHELTCRLRRNEPEGEGKTEIANPVLADASTAL